MSPSLAIYRVQNSQDGSTALSGYFIDNFIVQVPAGADGSIILSGKTHGSYAATNLGYSDMIAVMLDTGALATPAPRQIFRLLPRRPCFPFPHRLHHYLPHQPLRRLLQQARTRRLPYGYITRPHTSSFASCNASCSAGPTQAASNVTPSEVGVSSAVAGAALIALGLCLRK